MENEIKKAEFEDVLLDVRKAYRLLYLYQRRVMDLVAFIGNQYGFVFENSGQQFSNPHRLNSPLSNWAWDFLGMYNFHYNFRPRNLGEIKNVAMQVLLVSDTGYYDNAANNSDKLHIGLFNSPEASRTELHLVLKSQGRASDDYGAAIEQGGTGEPSYYNFEAGQFIIGKKYPLSDMINEEATRRVLEDFRQFCIEQNIHIG